MTEDKTLVATGNVLTNDTDPDWAMTLSVIAVNGTAVSATGTTTIVGTYGTLVIQANGQYTYTLASSQANVLALATGQVVPDVFNYTISDGKTYTQTTTQTAQNLISAVGGVQRFPVGRVQFGFGAGDHGQCRGRPQWRRQHGRPGGAGKRRFRPLLP